MINLQEIPKLKSFISLKFKSTTDPDSALRNFKYKGTNQEGIEVKGIVSANTFSEAKFKLESIGVSVVEFSEQFKLLDMQFGKTVPPKVLLQVTRQLSSFAQAGIAVIKALQILSTTCENKQMRKVLIQIREEVLSGTTLTEAIRQHPKVFPSYFGAIIGAAEISGDLSGALITLNLYLERDLKSSRAIRSALYYPIILISLMFTAIIILALFVLPRFRDFFATLDIKLPLATRLMLQASDFVKSWYWLFLLLTLLSIVGYKISTKYPIARLRVDKFKLKLPVLGGFIELVAVERFCRVLATLVKSAVTLPEALILAGRSTSNLVFETKIKEASVDVLQGQGLASPLAKTKIFPTAAIQIFQIGEESGQLEAQLSQAANFYSDELDHRVKTFTSLLEPVVLLIVGLGIGLMSVSLISAMYGIFKGLG